jgi:hypothetical protein
MGRYAWTAVFWIVFGIVVVYLMTPQNACFVRDNQGLSFFGVVWITILGGLLIADMLTWKEKNGTDKLVRKRSRLG